MGPVDGEATDAVERVVRAEYGRLVRAVALSCGSVAEAEDAVQEAFGRAWERAQRGELPNHLEGWVVTVALNESRSAWRRTRRNQPLGGRPRAALSALDPELVDLRDAVSTLPARQREVVVLHYYLGYPVREIAGLLAVSEGNVKNALFRARNSLATALRVEEEVPNE
jgi:RNA polymerase sigma-70 factor (ECF subfamily)